MATNNKYLVGVYGDDDITLKAVKSIRAANIKIHEVFSPFPIHGIDEALVYKHSRLPKAAFMFGALGLTLALTMQFWMLGYDWQMIIGGKNLKPYKKPKIFDIRITDDKHVIAIDLGQNKLAKEEISKIVADTGAEEVNEKSFD